MQVNDRIIVALDLSTIEQANHLIARLGDRATHYKIGPVLLLNGGLRLATILINKGLKVFLDLKLYDVPSTVEAAVVEACRLGCSFVTVHAYQQVMNAAMQGTSKIESPTKVLGVTVLTSMNGLDLSVAGYALQRDNLIMRRALQAGKAGVDGIVCAPPDLCLIRDIWALNRPLGAGMLKVTPGIRWAGDFVDHRYASTPFTAFQDGADYIVVGRPITHAEDPPAAFEYVLEQSATAIETLRAAQ